MPGTAGNLSCDSGTRVLSESRGCALAGGSTPSRTQLLHCGQKGTLGPGVFVSIRLLRPRTLRRQIPTRNVLRARKQVDANVVGYARIGGAVERRVGQRGRATAAPVFTR